MAGQRLQFDDFYSSWERQYRGDEAPPSIFLHHLRNQRGSCDILAELEKERDSLETRKQEIENDLRKVEFCLWWIKEAPNRDSGVHSTYGEDDPVEDIQSEKRDSFKAPLGAVGDAIQEEVKVRPRRKRSQSLAEPARLKEVRAALCEFEKRRGSFHGIQNSDHYENMSFKPPPTPRPTTDRPPSGPLIPPKTRSQSFPVNHSRDSTHDEESSGDDIYDRIPRDATKDFTEVVAYLCRILPAKEASDIVYSMEKTKVKVSSNRDSLNERMTRWISDGQLGRLLQLLDEHRLYDIHKTVETILHEDGTTVPPPVPSSPRPGRKTLGSGIRDMFPLARRDGTGSLSRTHSSGARLSDPNPGTEKRHANGAFLFGVLITADYVPAGVRGNLINGYRWLSIVRGQQMDVIGTHTHEGRELYIARNEEGEIGLVSPGKCDVLSNATPVIWATDWFITDINQYADRLRNAQTGAYYIRKSNSNPGDMTLTVNTGSPTPTKFGIAIHKSTYILTVASGEVYNCQSIKELITHYKTHYLPTDTKTNVCLTVPCKKIL